MTEPTVPDEPGDLAAEYALGVLEGEERLRAQALQRSDPAFAAAVEMWQVRLAPLLREVGERAPGDHVWNRISGRIEANDGKGALRSMRRWRLATFATGAVAVTLAALLFVPRQPAPVPAPPPVAQQPAEQHVAQLVDPAGKPVLTVRYDAQAGTMRVRATELAGENHVPELWIIPEGGAPHSLGPVAPDGSTRVIPPAKLKLLVRDGATLAITMEDPAGIPHDAPTGKIVASGTITTI